MLEIEGYYIFRLDRTVLDNQGYRKRGGGILFYIRNDCHYELLPDTLFNISNKYVEIASLSICHPHTRKLYIITVYRPQDGNFKKFSEPLDNILKLLSDPDKLDIVVGGDFNIDYSKSCKENTKKLKHLTTKHSLAQNIWNPTGPLGSEAVIDLIFTN